MSHSPSSAFKSRTVMRGWHHVVFWGLTGLLALAALRFAVYWRYIPEWADRPVAMGVLTIVLLLFVAQYLQSWNTMPRMRRPVPPAPQPNQRVALATTFVPGSEPLEMLELTVSAMVAVSYPHDTWVLDEGNDPDVAELCARLGALHYSRNGRDDLNRPDRSLAARTKYGNINAWLQEKGFGAYDVFGFFDPDHVPEPDFLHRTMGYLQDPKVGFVQGAQIYYNQGGALSPGVRRRRATRTTPPPSWRPSGWATRSWWAATTSIAPRRSRPSAGSLPTTPTTSSPPSTTNTRGGRGCTSRRSPPAASPR